MGWLERLISAPPVLPMAQLKKISHNYHELTLKLGVEIKQFRTKLEIKSLPIVAQLPME